jgi:hypothetical protein
LLGLLVVEDEAAVSGITTNNTWTSYVTISNREISFWYIVSKLKLEIKDLEHFSFSLLIEYW